MNFGYNISFDVSWKSQKKRIIEGYWKEKSNNKLPVPVSNKSKFTKENEDFLKILELIENYISSCNGERNTQIMGWSNCRICGKKNGTIEYILPLGKNSDLVWPGGLMHYYKDHKVLPSQFFVDKIHTIHTDKREQIEQAIQKEKEYKIWYASLTPEELEKYDKENQYSFRLPIQMSMFDSSCRIVL
jgi:hypothetical protein